MQTTFKKFAFILGMSLLFATLIALILQFSATQLFNRIEYVTYDWRYRHKYHDVTENDVFPDYGIHIVDIDERSMEKMGSFWGWDRSYQARMVDSLSSRFPAAIAFDVLFYDREDEIHRKRVALTLDEVISGDTALAELSGALHDRLTETVNYDEQFIRAIKRSGRVTLGLSMAEESNYRNYTSQVLHRMDMDWHNSLNPASALTFPDSLLERVLHTKTVIDGIYPENASVARSIGHVNVVDASTVIRMTPLLYKFAAFRPMYLPMSLRVAATLFGTPNEEIVFKPEQYIDIGKPFKIFKDGDGRISFSYPDFNETQLKMIMTDRAEIASLAEGEKVTVSTYAALYRDEHGRACLETRAGRFPHEVTASLLGDRNMRLDKMGVDEEAAIGGGFTVRRDSNAEWEIYNDDESFWLRTIDVKTLASIVMDYGSPEETSVLWQSPMPEGTDRMLLTFDFTVRREGGVLVSPIPVLRAGTLDELLAGGMEAIELIPPGGRRDYGKPARIPLQNHNLHIVTYFGPKSKPFTYFSFYDVMENNVKASMEGKVFIVGSTSPAMFDIKSAPHEMVFPAVEIHASIMNSIFTDTYVRRLSERQDILILILAGLTAALIAFFTKPFLGGLIVAGLLIAYGFASLLIFDSRFLWIEMVRPMITIVLSFTAVMVYRYMTEERNRKYLQSTFKQYLSPELIDMMYTQKQKPKLGGDEGELTAFFTDIAGFSSFSEKLTPTQLVELLNEYLTAMTDILLAKGGTLDKYIGDAIVAFFGAPVFIPNHASMACHTALAMQEKLAELREKWRGEEGKWPSTVHNMRMRIGINTGNITTGNMGSAVRMNYTMMGDSVNLAARLESAAKYYGVYTMISNYTHDMITTDAEIRRNVNNDISLLSGQTGLPANKDDFETRVLDVITVAGKSEPVTIYELLCRKSQITPEIANMLNDYNRGVGHYYNLEWDKALECFERSDKFEQNRKNDPNAITPSSRFAEMCRKFIDNPPGPEWDGVNRLDKK